MNDCTRCGTKGGRDVTHACVSGYGMNLEVERYPGELAKLRRLKERVMALPRHHVSIHRRVQIAPNAWSYGMEDFMAVRAADIDEALKEAE